mmetsp:Transcript_38841/g.84551  ORF Transcript_38841/g.84551 Transcript_38841/m.84551 type:complete len:326 (-) Transcript_38841:63-1040(-)
MLHVVEVAEEHQQRHHVHHQQLGEELGVGGEVEAVHRLDEVHEELEHLHLGEVAPPPEVLAARLLVLGQHRRHEVVGVHAHVHPRVERRREVRVATGGRVANHPPDPGDGAVVVHVQEGDLVHVALQQHNERVHELIDLGNVENPDDLRHLRLRGVVSVAPEGVLVEVSLIDNLQAHVQAKTNEEDVVHKHERLQQEGVLPLYCTRECFAIHQPRTNNSKIRHQAQYKRRRALHQGQILCRAANGLKPPTNAFGGPEHCGGHHRVDRGIFLLCHGQKRLSELHSYSEWSKTIEGRQRCERMPYKFSGILRWCSVPILVKLYTIFL